MGITLNRAVLGLVLGGSCGMASLTAHPLQLSIENQGADLIVSWPDQGPGKVYTLQGTTDLNRPWFPRLNWDDWPNHATTFQEPLGEEATRFYRLAITERGRVASLTDRGDPFPAAALNQFYIPNIEAEFNIDIPFSATYDVAAYRIDYETLDGTLGPAMASGMIFVPQNKSEPADLLSYQHGTVQRRIDAPSGPDAQEALIGLIMASNGYVVAMPDYLGLGPGSTGLHPYVHRRTSATAVVDMLRATRTAAADFPEISTDLSDGLSGKLFLFGYSQGGYVTLAAQQEIEQKHASEFQITASAPSDGPYDLSGAMTDIMTSNNSYGSPNYLPYMLFSYNEIYHLFDDPAEVFVEPYATTLPPLFDGEHSGGEIDAAMPPSGVPSEILRPDYLRAFSTDPDHPFRKLLRENDLLGWAPITPTRLFHCAADELVPYENARAALASFLAAGADPALVSLVDPDPSGSHGTCLFSAVPLIIEWFESLR